MAEFENKLEPLFRQVGEMNGEQLDKLSSGLYTWRRIAFRAMAHGEVDYGCHELLESRFERNIHLTTEIYDIQTRRSVNSDNARRRVAEMR